jgi:tetratricopeptide (TPR) repeat protein
LTKTEIPVENQNNSNLGLNGFGFGAENGSDNSSMMLPSFQELDTLNMPNAPEVSITKKPSIPHYKAGLKAYNLGKYPKAIEEFNKSIANNESAPKAIDMYLGIMLSEKNEYDDAIQHFKAFIKSTPDNAKAHYLLGKCYRKNKDWQNLINTYQLFIEGELEATPKMKKRIYQDMGTACAILGKCETAVRLLTALYKLETDNAEIGYYLALALYKMKKTSEAAVIIDKAAKTAPKGKPLEKQITVLSQTIRAGVPVSE